MMLHLPNKKFLPLFKYFTFVVLLLFSCNKSTETARAQEPIPSPIPAPPSITLPSTTFAKGSDISWVTHMEAQGRKFYNSAGVETDCFSLMKSLGMNTIRLRVWVNPNPSWNDLQDVVTKALRAKQANLRVMINFHYSDSWADPGKQTKPSAWSTLSVEALRAAIDTHTRSVLQALKTAGIEPEWVQVGNETNDGMLWPNGKASQGGMATYAQFVNTGYDAVKSVFPNARVIVHLSNGFDNSLYQWNIGGLISNGAKFDVIGLSLYPNASNWEQRNNQCQSNMTDLVERYNKEVMLVEVGMPWDQPDVCKLFLTDIISKTRAIRNNKGIGVLYWEPQSYAQWQGYTLGAFDNSGKPTIALTAFSN